MYAIEIVMKIVDRLEFQMKDANELSYQTKSNSGVKTSTIYTCADESTS